MKAGVFEVVTVPTVLVLVNVLSLVGVGVRVVVLLSETVEGFVNVSSFVAVSVEVKVGVFEVVIVDDCVVYGTLMTKLFNVNSEHNVLFKLIWNMV